MPRISRYEASDGKLAPDSKGYESFETAGRRIGPLYNQAAQSIEKEGELQAQGIKASGWPLEFDRFRPQTVSIRFTADKNAGPGRLRSQHDISNGAPVLSNIARQMVREGSPFPPEKPETDIYTSNDVGIDYKRTFAAGPNDLTKDQENSDFPSNTYSPNLDNPNGGGGGPQDTGYGGGNPASPDNVQVGEGTPTTASSSWNIPAWFDWAGPRVGTVSPDAGTGIDNSSIMTGQ